MGEIEQRLNRTNELLERLISIQEDVQTRQKKFLKIYKAVLIVAAIWLVIYIGLEVFLM